jgi:hypothetical protein
MMGAQVRLHADATDANGNAGGFAGLAVPDVLDIVRSVCEVMGIDAWGFEDILASMAAGDVEPDLRVAALGAMSILAASPARGTAGGPAIWLQSALASLEDEDGMVREAALLALQALAPSADEALIAQLLPRIYLYHLALTSSAAQSSAASPIPGGKGRGGAGCRGAGANAPGRSLKESIIPAAAPSRPWRQSGIGAPARAAPGAEVAAADADSAGSRQESQKLSRDFV